MATIESLGHGKVVSRPRTQGFVTKRAHKKSRAGCWGCKQRKIKCDESRPQCTYCKTHKVQCFYSGHTAASPISQSSDEPSVTVQSSRASSCALEKASRVFDSPKPSLSLFSNWNANDMRLLHHYSTFTSSSLLLLNRQGVDQIVQFEIPRLAFEHDFMMHCVLGVASLHLRHLAPEAPENQSLTVVHRLNAISGLRAAISQLSKDSFGAILTGSLFLLILSSDLSMAETSGELWIGNWLGLWAGLRETINVVSWKFLMESGLKPIFAWDENRRSALKHLPHALSDMLLSMDPADEDTRIIFSNLSCLSRLYQYLLLNGLAPELTVRIVAWPANTDIAEFAALAKRGQPHALIIAAYYLVFTKLVDEIWWMADISSPEIEKIACSLPLEYQSLMSIPLQSVHLRSKWDIASLLLSQLPEPSFYEHDLKHILLPDCLEEVG